MLHGMADRSSTQRVVGLRVRDVPVGEMIPGMAYLVRRLLENTSNESWLKAGFLDNAEPEVLLRAPAPAAPSAGENGAAEKPDLSRIGPERHQMSPAHPGVGDGRAFFNEPLRDFSRAPVREAFGAALASARVPIVASDRTPEHARAMVGAAHRAFPAWRDADPLLRCRVLTLAAAEMRRRRDELSGVIVRENGKCWRDADADTAEAIDFCEYYARFAPLLSDRRRIGRFIGELDQRSTSPGASRSSSARGTSHLPSRAG